MNRKNLQALLAGTMGVVVMLVVARDSGSRAVTATPTWETAELADGNTQLINLTQQEVFAEPLLLAQQQQARVALVIGNANYEDDPLTNPINDATAIHQTLDELGFDMLPLVTDANKQEMVEAIRNFQDRLEEGATGVFYYAGHGVQVDGVNYLVPTGSNLEREAEAEFEAVNLDRVIAAMNSAQTQFNVLIVDACRDNPFYRRWRRTRGSNTRGLSVNRPPRGTLIAYATEPDGVAEDGIEGSRHSPYTQSLLTHLQTPGISIFDMLTLVTEDVFEATDAQQAPYFEGSLQGYFSFNPHNNSSSDTIAQASTGEVTTSSPTPLITPTANSIISGAELESNSGQSVEASSINSDTVEEGSITSSIPDEERSSDIIPELLISELDIDSSSPNFPNFYWQIVDILGESNGVMLRRGGRRESVQIGSIMHPIQDTLIVIGGSDSRVRLELIDTQGKAIGNVMTNFHASTAMYYSPCRLQDSTSLIGWGHADDADEGCQYAMRISRGGVTP